MISPGSADVLLKTQHNSLAPYHKFVQQQRPDAIRVHGYNLNPFDILMNPQYKPALVVVPERVLPTDQFWKTSYPVKDPCSAIFPVLIPHTGIVDYREFCITYLDRYHVLDATEFYVPSVMPAGVAYTLTSEQDAFEFSYRSALRTVRSQNPDDKILLQRMLSIGSHCKFGNIAIAAARTAVADELINDGKFTINNETKIQMILGNLRHWSGKHVDMIQERLSIDLPEISPELSEHIASMPVMTAPIGMIPNAEVWPG